MKTVIERRDDLYERYIPHEAEEILVYDSRIPQRTSCFYDFGVRKNVGFGELISPPTKDFEN